MPRRALWTVAALAAGSAAILWASPAQYLGRQQDDIVFVIASQSLSHGSYRLFTTPGQPPIVATTPGLPALLLPVSWLCADRLGAYQAFSALLLAGVPWLLWWWLRRRLGEPESVLIALLFATSPLVLSQAGTVMSEGPYTALAVLFLAAVESGRWAPAGALLLALTQGRPAGFSLLPTALAGPWRSKDWRAALWSVGPTAAAALAWHAWARSVSEEPGKLQMWGSAYRGLPWRQPLGVAWENLRYFLEALGGAFLPLGWSQAAWLAGAALAALALRGAWELRREEQARPALLMLGGAAVMHALWPWHYDRYLIPVLAWLLWLAAAGAGRRARWLLGLLLGLQLAFHSPRWLAGVEAWRRPELARSYAWLRTHAAPSDVVASALFVRDGFYASRPSAALPDTDDPLRFAAALRRSHVRYVLRQDDVDVGLSQRPSAAIGRRLDRALGHLEDRGLFRVAHEEREERAAIYELR